MRSHKQATELTARQREIYEAYQELGRAGAADKLGLSSNTVNQVVITAKRKLSKAGERLTEAQKAAKQAAEQSFIERYGSGDLEAVRRTLPLSGRRKR